jgi:hypothetical protein
MCCVEGRLGKESPFFCSHLLHGRLRKGHFLAGGRSSYFPGFSHLSRTDENEKQEFSRIPGITIVGY